MAEPTIQPTAQSPPQTGGQPPAGDLHAEIEVLTPPTGNTIPAPPEAQAVPGTPTPPLSPEFLAAATAHLESVSEHLQHVADGTEKAINPVPPPPATSPQRLPPLSATRANTSIQPASSEMLGAPNTWQIVRVPLMLMGIAAFTGLLLQSLLSGQRTITWLALLSLNVVGTVGFNLMLRKSAWKQADQWLTATVLQTGLFLPFITKELAVPIKFPHYTGFEILLLGIAVTCLMSLQICNVKALQHLEASVFSVVFNSRIMFATIFGMFFLSEAIGFWALAGGALIFAAIFIVRQRGTKSVTVTGILFGLGAALSMSIMNTCEKELIKLVGYQQYIFPMFGVAAVIMWLVVAIRRTPVPLKVIFSPQGLGLMALRACAGIGFSSALIFGPVAISSYISSLSVVGMVIVGMVFLRERDYLNAKVLATMVALCGLTFILLDRLSQH